jgi:hypothetical protein
VILATAKDTGLPAHIWVHEITKIEAHSWGSRIFLENPKMLHMYSLDVLESPSELNKRIKHGRLDLGCETRSSLNM